MGKSTEIIFSILLITLTLFSPITSREIGLLNGESSSDVTGRTSKDTLEYISVSSVVLMVTVYSVALIIIPPCVILTVFLLIKLETLHPPKELVARALSKSDGLQFDDDSKSDCFRRISCEVITLGKPVIGKPTVDKLLSVLDINWNNGITQEMHISKTPRCSKYKCSKLTKWAKFKTKRSLAHSRQEIPEFNIIDTLPFLQSLIEGLMGNGDGGEENGLTYLIRKVGLWPHYIAAVIILSFPVTIFVVALFLVSLVVSPEESESERRNTFRKKKRSKRSFGNNEIQMQDIQMKCLLGIFCDSNKYS